MSCNLKWRPIAESFVPEEGSWVLACRMDDPDSVRLLRCNLDFDLPGLVSTFTHYLPLPQVVTYAQAIEDWQVTLADLAAEVGVGAMQEHGGSPDDGLRAIHDHLEAFPRHI